MAKEKIKMNPQGSYFLFGQYGQGKTHLAYAQYRILARAGEPTMFFSMAELLLELRQAELKLEDDYVCVVRDRARYATGFHLFIDDIDKFKATEFKFEVLFDLIDTMYRRKLGLTITSNLDLTHLSTILHPAIIRRLDDMCTAVEL